MTPTRLERTTPGLILVSLAVVASLADNAAGGEVTAPKAAVRENVPVHAGAGADSRIVGQLQNGEMVTIDLEVDGTAGRWCSVIQQGKAAPVGFVPCDILDRKVQSRRTWTLVRTETRAQPQPAPVPPQGATKPAREKRAYADVKVLLYYAWWCPQCTRARTLLQSLGVSIIEYDIEREPARKEEMVAKSGQKGIPVIDIEGTILVGFGESSIRDAVETRRASGGSG